MASRPGTSPPLRLVAFNGLAVSVPAAWEPASMGLRYLLLGCEDEPALELRWEPVRGHFSFERHRKRLARSLSGPDASLELVDPPTSWRKALDGFDHRTFRWRSQGRGGSGAVLRCRTCGTATVLRFHERAAPDDLAGRILASLRDHFPGEMTPYALYDMRLAAPTRLPLEHFAFQAGRFELRFATGRERLVCLRLSLARVMLERQDLAAIARAQLGASLDKAGLEPRPGTWGTEDHEAVNWIAPRPPGWLARARARIHSGSRRELPWGLAKIWHDVPADRLMLVAWTGRAPIDHDAFSTVCESFEHVPQETPQAD